MANWKSLAALSWTTRCKSLPCRWGRPRGCASLRSGRGWLAPGKRISRIRDLVLQSIAALTRWHSGSNWMMACWCQNRYEFGNQWVAQLSNLPTETLEKEGNWDQIKKNWNLGQVIISGNMRFPNIKHGGYCLLESFQSSLGALPPWLLQGRWNRFWRSSALPPQLIGALSSYVLRITTDASAVELSGTPVLPLSTTTLFLLRAFPPLPRLT